jgi:hypothetical protein
MLGCSIVDSEMDTDPIPIINASEDSILLEQGTTIGLLSPVNNIKDIFDEKEEAAPNVKSCCEVDEKRLRESLCEAQGAHGIGKLPKTRDRIRRETDGDTHSSVSATPLDQQVNKPSRDVEVQVRVPVERLRESMCEAQGAHGIGKLPKTRDRIRRETDGDNYSSVSATPLDQQVNKPSRDVEAVEVRDDTGVVNTLSCDNNTEPPPNHCEGPGREYVEVQDLMNQLPENLRKSTYTA